MTEANYESWHQEELIREIKRLKRRKKYGLVWEEKPEDVVEQCKTQLPVLTEDKTRTIITCPHKQTNLLIEGDNYHALSVLSYTHSGKVDVIYIDPPYNTGERDFKYNDKWIAKEDAYRHSKWLSFLSKRLDLAKRLLNRKGVIFISIDENEFAQLKLLCDVILGESNLVAIQIWRKVVGGKSQGKISTQHEYILTYARDVEAFMVSKLPLNKKLLKKYRYSDARGKYDLRELGQGKGLSYSDSLYYTITAPDGTTIPKPPEGKGYRWSKKKWEWGLKQNPPFCLVKKVKGRWLPFVKQYLDYDNKGKRIDRGVWANTWLDSHGYTRTGTKNLDDVVGEGKFEHPKPVKLIKYLIELHPHPTIIVDFFAGSGTTGQAVLELNKSDGGSRQFILCTNNEVDEKTENLLRAKGIKKVSPEYDAEGICQKVCYPRISNVITGYTTNRGKHKGLDGNLRYFKTTFVDFTPTDKNKFKLTQRATEMLCVKEDTFELMIDNERFKIFRSANHHTGIIWDQRAIPEFKEAIKNFGGNFSVYVFSLSDESFEEEFEDVPKPITLSPIPESILKVYRRIFK